MITRLSRIKKKGKRVYVRRLQTTGKIKEHTINGYLAYDSDELKQWYKTSRIGRPRKIIEEIEI